MNSDIESPEYRAYHTQVVAAIRELLFRRWPPRTQKEQDRLSSNLKFFDEQCTYDEDFAERRDPAEVAEDQIDAANDSR